MATAAQKLALTSQMLSFARMQLQFLNDDLNPFQERAVKHAFLTQLFQAFVCYLEEIDIFPAREKGFNLPVSQLILFFRDKLQTAAADFRAEEIAFLLRQGELASDAEDKAWLREFISVYETSQQATRIDKPQGGEPDDRDSQAGGLIIASVENSRLPYWWEHDKKMLNDYLFNLEKLIERQREHSVEA